MHDVMVGKKTKFFLPFAWNKGRKKELVGIRLSFSLSARFSLDRKLGRKEAGRRKRERKKEGILCKVSISRLPSYISPLFPACIYLSPYMYVQRRKNFYRRKNQANFFALLCGGTHCANRVILWRWRHRYCFWITDWYQKRQHTDDQKSSLNPSFLIIIHVTKSTTTTTALRWFVGVFLKHALQRKKKPWSSYPSVRPLVSWVVH